MASNMVDGFIFMDLLKGDQYFLEFEKLEIPYVCIGKIDGYDNYHFVASDHRSSMKEVMDHLISLNHRKIAMLLSDETSVTASAWVKSYTECLRDQNVEINPEYIISTSKYETNFHSNVYQLSTKLLKGPQRPTAVIAIPSHMEGLLGAVRDQGLRIPEDLSIVCMEYNDNHMLDYLNLTRVQSAAPEVSSLAFHKLLKTVWNNKCSFDSELIQLSLTIGSTTTAYKD